MIYRRFGRTELQMPVFSCGGMRFQQDWTDMDFEKITAENQAKLESCIHRSLEVGINHIETARGYGSSEVQLGQILPGLPREKLIVQTKISPAPAEEFLKTFETCMDRLKLDHVDLLSFHGINNQALLDLTLKKGGALEAGRKLQAEGRVRFLGYSTHGPCEVITAANNSGEFDYLNLHWYWVNQVNWPAIEAATRRDMGVFIISPNDKGGKLYEPPDKLRRLCEPYSPMIFNDLFCLRRPEVHTLSLGVARPSDFDEHLRALELIDRTDEIVPVIEERLRAAMEDSLGRDWCDRWQEGLPRWEDVPGEVNVWEILRLWSYARSLDMVDFGKMRYNLLGNADHWFPGKNVAGMDDKAMSNAVKSSPFADRLPGILREAHELLWDKPVERLSKTD
ncbi:MAG: aldo/keto reductase [Terrimicrobiaceae bacterium]